MALFILTIVYIIYKIGLIYELIVYILLVNKVTYKWPYLYINRFIHLIYKQLRLCINLYVKKQHVFPLYNDDLYSINTFQIKSSLI